MGAWLLARVNPSHTGNPLQIGVQHCSQVDVELASVFTVYNILLIL